MSDRTAHVYVDLDGQPVLVGTLYARFRKNPRLVGCHRMDMSLALPLMLAACSMASQDCYLPTTLASPPPLVSVRYRRRFVYSS